jgi:hypothetical protein
MMGKMSKDIDAFMEEYRWAFPEGQRLGTLNTYLAQKRK